MTPLQQLITRSRKHAGQITLTQKLEDTFGPNPCQNLTLTNQQTGHQIKLICDRKRCTHCGPRKQFILNHELQALGQHVYVARITNIAPLETALEAAKKRRQRHGENFRYTIVGDPTLGWIVVSDVELLPEMRYMALQDWMTRILELYHQAVHRIRRSIALVTHGLSVVVPRTPRSIGKQGTPWYRRTLNTLYQATIQDIDWEELRYELDLKHANLVTYPHPPTTADTDTVAVPDSLPIPY